MMSTHSDGQGAAASAANSTQVSSEPASSPQTATKPAAGNETPAPEVNRAGPAAVTGHLQRHLAADQAPADDVTIVAGIHNGEAWAAKALYERVQRPVQYALRRVLRPGDSEFEDLQQTCFERLVTSLAHKPRGFVCNLPAWSSRVATHTALDNLRRRSRQHRLFSSQELADNHDPAQPSPDAQLETRKWLERVQSTLARMRRSQAETLVLHDVLGHDLYEIAALTGVSVAAAQSRLVRGRKDFQRRLGMLGGTQ